MKQIKMGRKRSDTVRWTQISLTHLLFLFLSVLSVSALSRNLDWLAGFVGVEAVKSIKICKIRKKCIVEL